MKFNLILTDCSFFSYFLFAYRISGIVAFSDIFDELTVLADLFFCKKLPLPRHSVSADKQSGWFLAERACTVQYRPDTNPARVCTMTPVTWHDLFQKKLQKPKP